MRLVLACLFGVLGGYALGRTPIIGLLAHTRAAEAAIQACDHYAVALDKRLEEERETFWRALAICKP